MKGGPLNGNRERGTAGYGIPYREAITAWSVRQRLFTDEKQAFSAAIGLLDTNESREYALAKVP